jgi:hypothetical protein
MFEQTPITKSGSVNNFLRKPPNVRTSTHKTTVAWIFDTYPLKGIGKVVLNHKSLKTRKSVFLFGGGI